MQTKIKRYMMPKGCPVASVDIRELIGSQYQEAAAMADGLVGAGKMNVREMVTAERKEAVRLSIVRLGDRVIDHVVPLFQIDSWSRKAREALGRYFDDVNGLTMDAMQPLMKAATVLSDGKGRHGKLYQLPPECSIPSVSIWELGGHEELEAALKSDGMPDAGFAVTALRRRREIVGAAMRDQVPDWNGWTLRTITAISLYFEDVNGIPEDEISGCVAGAVDVSGETPAGMLEPQALEVAARTG